MTVKFFDVVGKADIVKISTLLVVAIGCWVWVWQEMQKPILPEGFDQNYFSVETIPEITE